MAPAPPTPYDAVNDILRQLVSGTRKILGDDFVAAYLQGSFAVGDFDEDSDVDFLIVTEAELSSDQLSSLQALHGYLYDLPSPWAEHLEGSYIPKAALWRIGAERRQFWFLDNCSRAMILSDHDDTQVVRWVTRERGITLAGPEPAALIDCVSANALRAEISRTMTEWGTEILAHLERYDNRWAQPYVVISFCRMLQTLATGEVRSKQAAVRWAQTTLPMEWASLAQRGWDDRPDVGVKARMKADPADLQATAHFLRYALDRRHEFWRVAENA